MGLVRGLLYDQCMVSTDGAAGVAAAWFTLTRPHYPLAAFGNHQ